MFFDISDNSIFVIYEDRKGNLWVGTSDGLNLFNKKRLNLFFATHSPFILSDIPKENIIFLKDGKNVSDEVEIDTFGANIHTLLSHGFFMEDGLMGEFAKEQINEVIKFLNDKDSKIKDKKEAQNIINMIGEPVIKNQLRKMLDSKKSNTISKLEEEIEKLKNTLDAYEEELMKKRSFFGWIRKFFK